jgi:HJR/Mrr/RecB family endonuclease
MPPTASKHPACLLCCADLRGHQITDAAQALGFLGFLGIVQIGVVDPGFQARQDERPLRVGEAHADGDIFVRPGPATGNLVPPGLPDTLGEVDDVIGIAFHDFDGNDVVHGPVDAVPVPHGQGDSVGISWLRIGRHGAEPATAKMLYDPGARQSRVCRFPAIPASVPKTSRHGTRLVLNGNLKATKIRAKYCTVLYMNDEADGIDANHAEDHAARGLYTGFEGYATPTESDYSETLRGGLVSLDTNVLLNLYRYDAATRSDFLSVLEHLGNQLWITNQAVTEFWRNREGVLRNPRDTQKTLQEIKQHEDDLIRILRTWFNRASFDAEAGTELIKNLETACGGAVDVLTKLAQDERHDYARDTSNDPILRGLSRILQGKVGPALDERDHASAIAEGLKRVENKVPPGYMDKKKGDERAAGDYLLWHQLLKEASQQEVPTVLLVTSDAKEDWWRIEAGERRGPRIELVAELRSAANAHLMLMRPATFLKHARTTLNIQVHPDSEQNVERVDEYLEGIGRLDLLSLSPTEFEHLVQRLFEGMGMHATQTTNSEHDFGVDLIAIDEDPLLGGLCVVQAKRYSKVVGYSAVQALAGIMEDRAATKGILVTTSWFGKSSQEFAARHGRIQLIDGRHLVSLLKEYLNIDALVNLRGSARDPDGS